MADGRIGFIQKSSKPFPKSLFDNFARGSSTLTGGLFYGLIIINRLIMLFFSTLIAIANVILLVLATANLLTETLCVPKKDINYYR